MEAGKRGAHVSVDVCFVLFSCVVLFTLERKFSSVVYVCVCLVGSHQPNLGILLTLPHCKVTACSHQSRLATLPTVN